MEISYSSVSLLTQAFVFLSCGKGISSRASEYCGVEERQLEREYEIGLQVVVITSFQEVGRWLFFTKIVK